MAVSIAFTLMAVSPLLMAHLLVSPGARKARWQRARTAAHRRMAQMQADEVALHRHVNNLLA